MNEIHLLSILERFCDNNRLDLPDYYVSRNNGITRPKLYQQYRNSLKTSPYPAEDNEATFTRFLESHFMKKKNSLAQFKTTPVPPPCIQGQCSTWTPIDDVITEGKTPMRYNDNYASASANITAPKSDTAIQRDYLISQLREARHPKRDELKKLFNLYVDNTPKTYVDLINIIKAGTYTIDQKIAKNIADDMENNDFYGYGPLYGIIWPGPVTDYDGFRAAEKDMEKQFTAAERIIITGDAAAGLAAVEAFEAWLPTPATPVAVAA